MAQKDPLKKAAYQKEYREKNKDKIKAYSTIRNQTINRKFTVYKSEAKRREIPFDILMEDFKIFWQVPCYYCGDPIDTIGIDRINSNLGYTKDNIRPCCTFCNYAKKDNIESYFEDKILKIAEKIKRRRCL